MTQSIFLVKLSQISWIRKQTSFFRDTSFYKSVKASEESQSKTATEFDQKSTNQSNDDRSDLESNLNDQDLKAFNDRSSPYDTKFRKYDLPSIEIIENLYEPLSISKKCHYLDTNLQFYLCERKNQITDCKDYMRLFEDICQLNILTELWKVSKGYEVPPISIKTTEPQPHLISDFLGKRQYDHFFDQGLDIQTKTEESSTQQKKNADDINTVPRNDQIKNMNEKGKWIKIIQINKDTILIQKASNGFSMNLENKIGIKNLVKILKEF